MKLQSGPKYSRRSTNKLSFLICFSLLAAMVRAADVREIVIPADQRGPQILAQLWTPCAAPSRPITPDSSPSRLTIKGEKGCAQLGKGLPLIIISHGLFGDMFSHHDTAEFLADAGFAVVALNHTLDSASSIKDKSADDISSFLVRPIDIKRVIDFLLTSSRASFDIDPRRIGFFGFSRGGYTGLVLAGGVRNFHAPPFPRPKEFVMCKQISDNNIPDHGPGNEPRFKTFVIADPVSFFPDKSSLQEVRAPIQLWSSDHGGMGVRPEHVASVAKNLPNAPEFHRPANSGHLSFNAPCSNEGIVCTDPPGFDRIDFHRKFNAQVLEFFRKNLSSDTDR
jgi:predicted dienelactone hydrolase